MASGGGWQAASPELITGAASITAVLPHLSGHVLDLHVFPRGLHVTDLDEPCGRGRGDGLLLLVQPRTLWHRLGHGSSLTSALLARWSGSDVEPGRGEEQVVNSEI